MIRRNFGLDGPINVVIYARMSSEEQNPRSPEQQIDAIQHELKRGGRPWTVVGTYRDDAISGRLVKRRPGLMQMVHDIKSGRIAVQAILVHTFERFGRADEMAEIRSQLQRKYGVLVLTCDSGFADPTSIAGQALGFVEQIRATSVNPVKAADVFRGKKDLAVQKRWPGGPPPFGCRLKYHWAERDGKPEIEFATLEPDPETAWIIKLLFEKAAESGWGTSRLARWLNEHPRIPNTCKPFYVSTVGYWLDQPIYRGELLWAENATDVIDDVRVLQLNGVEDQVRIPGFCQAIVNPETWERVQALRNLRRTKKERPAGGGGPAPRPSRPLGAGMVLKLMLSGLTRCGECGASMQPACSGRRSKAGQRYVYYVCPRARGRACGNRLSLREDYLRQAVIGVLRQKLFPIDTGQETLSWLGELFDRVRAELQQMASQTPDRREALQSQIDNVNAQQAGWLQSLGKPDLPQLLRANMEQQYGAAEERRVQLEQELRDLTQSQRLVPDRLDVQEVIARLRRLDQVLADINPTLANLELSRHIECIDVYGNGRVVMRTCCLGILDGAVRVLAKGGSEETAVAESTVPALLPSVMPRTRPKLRVDDADLPSSVEDTAPCTDSSRFANLDRRGFWEDVLEIPRTVWWAEAHAAEVAEQRAADPQHWTVRRLAERFGVTAPTIRKALRLAAGQAGRSLEPKPPTREASETALVKR